MSKKRDKLQVIHDILKVISAKDGNIKPTHVMYKSNLSHKMMDEYITEMIDKGLIEEHIGKKGKTYSVTNKGYGYMNQYKVIVNFMDSFGLT